MLKYCEKCGKTFQTTEKYCRICGEVLTVKEQPQPEKLDMKKIQAKFGTEATPNQKNNSQNGSSGIVPPPQAVQNIRPTASTNPEIDFTQSDVNAGIVRLIACTPKENKEFVEMLKNGYSLPPDITRSPNDSGYGTPFFYHFTRKVPKDRESVFLLSKIYSILSFIKNCFVAGIILAIFSVIIQIALAAQR